MKIIKKTILRKLRMVNYSHQQQLNHFRPNTATAGILFNNIENLFHQTYGTTDIRWCCKPK